MKELAERLGVAYYASRVASDDKGLVMPVTQVRNVVTAQTILKRSLTALWSAFGDYGCLEQSAFFAHYGVVFC